MAIALWVEEGDNRLLARLLLQHHVPEFARDWLLAAINGEVKRKRGRRKKKETLAQLCERLQFESDVSNKFQWLLVSERLSYEKGTPTELALEKCAEHFKITEDAVSRIVFQRKARNSGKLTP